MPTGRRLMIVIAPAAAICCGVGAGGVAQATTLGVKPSIERQTREVTNSAAERRLQSEAARANSASSVRKLIAPMQALERKLGEAATAVSHSGATTSTERTARTDWVQGVREDGRAIGQIVIAFRDIERGDKTGARRELTTAKRTALAGDRLVRRADTMLKIPIA